MKIKGKIILGVLVVCIATSVAFVCMHGGKSKADKISKKSSQEVVTKIDYLSMLVGKTQDKIKKSELKKNKDG